MISNLGHLINRVRCELHTNDGRSALPRMRELMVSALNQLLRGFAKTEARELEGYLNRMLANAPTHS